MSLAPRVVVVYRRSELDEMLERHATRGQVEYFLKTRGRSLAGAVQADAEAGEAKQAIGVAIPPDWRRVDVERADLPRFLFAPEDIVAVVGRDGLVANVAKYVDGQPIAGFNPFPEDNAGVLTPFPPLAAPAVLASMVSNRARLEQRTMVRARSDDGQEIIALNDVYIGDHGHQSARYALRVPGGATERQSSSGVIVGTGTGATGWLSSLAHDRALDILLPEPEEPSLTWFVREAWPSPFTGVELTAGPLREGETLTIEVESEALVVFGDGIETDHLDVVHGQRVEVDVAKRCLNLVAPGKAYARTSGMAAFSREAIDPATCGDGRSANR